VGPSILRQCEELDGDNDNKPEKVTKKEVI
jgi:hypothetical protein